MLQDWFIALTHAVESATLLALAAAFAWGVLSIVLSPCHLASIPLIVAYLTGQEQLTTRRTLLLSSVFAGGILVTIAAIGAITAAAGRVAGDLGGWVYYLVAGLFLLVGLHLLGLLPLPQVGRAVAGPRGRGAWGALLLGLVFGAALGPCTFAFMAPVLGLTFKIAAMQPWFAAALLLLFAVGHCAVIIVAGVSAEAVQRYLHWHDRAGLGPWFRGGCGVLVVLGGLYLVWTAP